MASADEGFAGESTEVAVVAEVAAQVNIQEGLHVETVDQGSYSDREEPVEQVLVEPCCGAALVAGSVVPTVAAEDSIDVEAGPGLVEHSECTGELEQQQQGLAGTELT